MGVTRDDHPLPPSVSEKMTQASAIIAAAAAIAVVVAVRAATIETTAAAAARVPPLEPEKELWLWVLGRPF